MKITNDLIINCCGILVKKEVNIRYLIYCFDKKFGFKCFNKTQNEENKLTKDEWDFLKKVIPQIK